jgi:hypothetical protein
MRTRRSCRQIRPVFRRSFRRPVVIRVETEPPRSADRIEPLLPAGTLLLSLPRPTAPRRPQVRVIRLEAPSQPDWRIVGDHDPEVAGEWEGVEI